MLVVFDTEPSSGRNDQEFKQLYHDLTGLVAKIPKHEINILFEDRNVREQERLRHENMS